MITVAEAIRNLKKDMEPGSPARFGRNGRLTISLAHLQTLLADYERLDRIVRAQEAARQKEREEND